MDRERLSKIRKLTKKQKVSKDELILIKEFLDECSKSYYNKDQLIITNIEYDNMYDRYLELGGKPFSGAEPEENLISRNIDADHNYQELVGTTLKARSIDELKDWLSKIYELLKLNKKKDKLELCVTLKFDGNSILIEYDENGNVIRALTRGKNGKGKDLTIVFKDTRFKINNIYNQPLAIKYECLIKYSSLTKIEKLYGKSYANLRNAVSGMLNGGDALKYKDFYTLEPLWMKFKDKDCIIDRIDEFEFYQNLNQLEEDNTSNVYIVDGNFNELIDQLVDIRDEIIDERNSLDFMIDGMVIDITDSEYREILGFQDGGENLKPKWCIALKFPYMEAESEVTEIKFSVADSGRISPVCHFKPVKIIGGIHRKQYLQGYKRFKELQLCKGTRISVQLHNDTLSYIERLDTIEDDKKLKRKPIPFIKNCPKCGEPIKITVNEFGEETFAYCVNECCPGKSTGRINNYLTKMDIKGVKINTVKKLHEYGIWNTIEDIYTFEPERAYNIEGLGQKSIDSMVRAIEKKKYFDYEIIGSLGIRNVGMDTSKSLFNEYSLDDLMDAVGDIVEISKTGTKGLYEEYFSSYEEQLCEIDGISEITAKRILNGMIKNYELIRFLMSRGYRNLSETNAYDDVRYTFVITGDLESCSRDQFKRILERHGHKLVGSISNNTDYLITNTPNSGTVKNKRAKELGKEIITEVQCIEMLNLNMDEEIKLTKNSL